MHQMKTPSLSSDGMLSQCLDMLEDIEDGDKFDSNFMKDCYSHQHDNLSCDELTILQEIDVSDTLDEGGPQRFNRSSNVSV